MKQDNVTLSVQALSRFNAKFKPGQSTAMKSVVAALYLADSDRILKYTNMIGLLQLDQDRKLKTKCLRMYNMDTMRLAFQVELYYDFVNHYQKLDDKFYYFDCPVGTVGLLFRNKQEADIMAIKIKSEAPTIKNLEQFIDQIKTKEKTKEQANSWFGYLKRKVLGKQEIIQESSEIHGIKKICNMKIDSEGKFNTQGESPFQVDLIERLGLSEKEKKSPQMMNMIVNDLFIHQLKKQAIQNPKPQIIQFIQQHQKQQIDYLQQIQQTKLLKIPPPPPPPPLLHPQNRMSMARMTNNNRANLMDEIRNNKIQLKHVKTNQKGGLNIDTSAMDNNDRDDFATALRKKIAMRKIILGKYKDSDQESD